METITAQMHVASLQRSLAFFESMSATARDQPEILVPGCPRWTVAELYGHLGTVHRWVMDALRLAGTDQRPGPRRDDSMPLDADPFDFFSESVPELLSALASADPQSPGWTFGPPPRLVSFWFRRLDLEHLTHAEDLAQVFDVEAPSVDDAVALDGVDEVLTVFLPQRIRNDMLVHPERALGFEAAGRRWVIGEGNPTVMLYADPLDLFHGLWRRRPLLAKARVDGDRDVFEKFLLGDYVP